MEDAREQAREHMARLRGSMQPHVDSVQTRIRQVPDRLQNISLPEQLQRIPRSFPSPRSPRGHARSASDGSPPPSPAQSPSPSPLATRAPPLPLPPPQLLQRASSLTAPARSDPAYSPELAALAGRILYRSPGCCPVSSGPLMVLCASAFPDASAIDHNVLLPYVLANLPTDDELSAPGDGYSIVFFAGGSNTSGGGGVGGDRPPWKWTLQAYTLVGVFREIARTLDEDPPPDLADGRGGGSGSGGARLGRAVRKKIQRLWVVHEKNWIRMLRPILPYPSCPSHPIPSRPILSGHSPALPPLHLSSLPPRS